MADFSELEEAFFRAGDALSELSAEALAALAVEPESPTWWQTLFLPAEVETYYASYELLAA